MSADLRAFRRDVVSPGLALLHDLGGPRPHVAATAMLLAIARQEGGPDLARVQRTADGGRGPARGAWQMERGGGVHGVMYHPETTRLARALVAHQGMIWGDREVWAALEHDDLLAAGFARLLLLTDPYLLPTEENAGWECYLRCWRPGRPRPGDWSGSWRAAQGAL